VPPHIKKLDDCFGQFWVRVVSDCGACREIEPEALARLVGWKLTLKQLALRMRLAAALASWQTGRIQCEHSNEASNLLF